MGTKKTKRKLVWNKYVIQTNHKELTTSILIDDSMEEKDIHKDLPEIDLLTNDKFVV